MLKVHEYAVCMLCCLLGMNIINNSTYLDLFETIVGFTNILSRDIGMRSLWYGNGKA